MDNFNKFKKSNPEKTLKHYRSKGDRFWTNAGEKMALELFRRSARRVPAYKDFLRKNNMNPARIKTIKDFAEIPITDKDNYINKYKLKDLCWDGKIDSSYFLSASSGSTGIPNFWPRSTEQTFQGASISELIYKEYFQADKKSTLYIVAFAMGMWIAGTYMMMSTDWVAQKGYPITIATPGLNKDEILRLVNLGSLSYDQTILVGYPPFVKDIIEYGEKQKLNWKKINVKFLFSGEAFTERWREYVSKKVNLKDPLNGMINIYGSADVGLVAHETPLTNLIRKTAAGNPEVNKLLFASDKVPALMQYDPRIRYFEVVRDELVVTAPSGLPLIRYNTSDRGNLIFIEELERILLKSDFIGTKNILNYSNKDACWNLPIVYLFGRSKFSVTIYGITLSSEHIKYVLDYPKLVRLLTGKYIANTVETAKLNQKLIIRLELSEGVVKSRSLAKLIKEIFVSEMRRVSSEYKHLTDSIRSRAYPQIILTEYGHPEHFPRGVIKKNA